MAVNVAALTAPRHLAKGHLEAAFALEMYQRREEGENQHYKDCEGDTHSTLQGLLQDVS